MLGVLNKISHTHHQKSAEDRVALVEQAAAATASRQQQAGQQTVGIFMLDAQHSQPVQ